MGFENYTISETGDVYSKERVEKFLKKGKPITRIRKGRKMTVKLDRYGYLNVGLRTGNKQYFRTIHRLLATTYIPNPENKAQINHKDGNKLNNDLSNLEWVSAKENTIHAVINGLMKPTEGCLTKPKNNTSGFIGVHKRRNYDRWLWSLQHKGERVTSKSFATIAEAVSERNKYIKENNLEGIYKIQ